MNVGQLIEKLQEYPDYRRVHVDGIEATEVSETADGSKYGGSPTPRVVIR